MAGKKRKKRITLLVGGKGMLGRAIAPLLKKEGRKVIILTDIKRGEKKLIPRGTEEVMFLANSGDYRNPVLSEDLFFVNVELLVRVLRDSAAAGVRRFAYFSSGSVYQPTGKMHREDNRMLCTAPTAYVATKCAAEILFKAWITVFERPVIYRPFFNYGPGQNSKSLFSSMFGRIMKGERIDLANGKGLVFNPIYSADAARFILHSLRLKDGFDIYNVAGKETTNLFEVTGQIASVLNKNPCYLRRAGKEDIVLGDITKMQLTGFRHKIFLNVGLRKMLEYLKGLYAKGIVL